MCTAHAAKTDFYQIWDVCARVFTYVFASRGSGVHSHDDSMLELEGQGGRTMVQLDVHPRLMIARLDKHRGLKANKGSFNTI